MKKLSERQNKIMNYIKSEVLTKGYPPSVREIGEAVGLMSSSTVHGHLQKLEEKGYIRRDPTKPRAIEILDKDDTTHHVRVAHVPIVGSVTAGTPILATENIEEYYPIPHDFVANHEVFILQIKGDSMIEAGIFDKDYVIVQKQESASNGEIVVAMVEDNEATVKRFFNEGDHIRLQPENSSLSPILVNNVTILGKVVGLFRRIK